MDEYFAGLSTWWAAQSTSQFYVGIGGRLRNNIARQDEVKPYCVFTQVDGTPEYFMDDGSDELYFMENQFDIYSETNLEVLSLAKKAMTLFDNASFTVSGWSILEFRRTRNMLLGPDMNQAIQTANFDFMIHRYLITYDVIMQKS